MGLDYSYIVVAKKSDKESLVSYIANNIDLESTDFGVGATIEFKIDEVIDEYLQEVVNEFQKAEHSPETNSLITTGTAKIGYIYFDIKEPVGSEFIFASFTAATTNMSLLFSNSTSIQTWFINFSKSVNAIAVFQDLEDQEYKLIHNEGIDLDIIVDYLKP